MSSDSDTAWRIVQNFDQQLGGVVQAEGSVERIIPYLPSMYEGLRRDITQALASKGSAAWPESSSEVAMRDPIPTAPARQPPPGGWQETKRPSKDELVKVLTEEGMIKSNVARRLGVSLTSVKRWLIHYGIDYQSGSEGSVEKAT